MIVFQSTLVLKIRAHCQHHMSRGVVVILSSHCIHKLCHSLIDIVALQVWIILRKRGKII